MMHIRNRIIIHAPPDLIYQLAAHIEHWPILLEHYRFVKVLEDLERSDIKQSRVVKMSAYRGFIPTTWTSIQDMYPEKREISFKWIKGIPKGMDVIWRIEPTDDGVQVTIDHDLVSPRWWWLRNSVAMYVLGTVFIENVAGKTLAGIKRHAETRAAPGIPATSP